jgi:ribosomal protein S18 acetylase RimI-like enzyme
MTMVDAPLALVPPDSSVHIRPVRLEDVESLHRECWPERSLASIYHLVVRATRNQQQGRGLGIVVIREEPGRQVAGFGQLTLWTHCGEISDLVIAPLYRNQGLGTAMIQHLVRASSVMHVPCVEIGAAYSNPRALALYRRLGFQDTHIAMLDLGSGHEPVQFLRLKVSDRS